MSGYYPVCLKVAGKDCVVVGGGQVALRKVLSLLECQARVTVISPRLCAGLADLAAREAIRVREREFNNSELEGAWLVIAATSSHEANLEVAREARRIGALVNIVDNADESDFILPSVLRRGNITIAISSSGASPALARKIRTQLDGQFGEEYAHLTRLISEVRKEMKQAGVKVEPEEWQEALQLDELIKIIHLGEWEQAKTLLRANLKSAEANRK